MAKLKKSNTVVENGEPITVMQTLSKIGIGPLRTGLLLNPGATEWRQRLITTLDLWSLEETSITLYQFCREYGLAYRLFCKWCEKYEDLGDMRDEVKLRIGDTHYRDAYRKRASETLVLKDLHKYWPEWADVNKYHADLRKDEQLQQGIQVVYIKDAPDTGKVKPKKKRAITTESSNE